MKVSRQEKNVMEGILRRFEKLENEDESLNLLDSDDEDEVDDNDVGIDSNLDNLKSLDLNTASIEDMLNAMSIEQRKEFEEWVEKQNVPIDLWTPWWWSRDKLSEEYFRDNVLSKLEKNGSGMFRGKTVRIVDVTEGGDNDRDLDENGNEKHHEQSSKPTILENLKPMDLNKTKVNSSILYNLGDILFAYSFTTRYFNGAHHEPEELIPFASTLLSISTILSRKDAMAYTSLTEALTCAKESLYRQQLKPSLEMIARAYQDVYLLLLETEDVMVALSDLWRVFDEAVVEIEKELEEMKEKNSRLSATKALSKLKAQVFAAKMKVWFYLCFIHSEKSGATSREGNAISLWDEMGVEMYGQCRKMQHDVHEQRNMQEEGKKQRERVQRGPLIMELE